MLQDIKKLLERNALSLAIAATVFLTIMSLVSVPKIDLGLGIKSGDKYLHFFAYLCLTMMWFFALKDKIEQKLFKFFLPLGLIMYGIILEGLQNGLTSYRTGDMYDAVANTIGVLVGLMTFRGFIRWYRTI